MPGGRKKQPGTMVPPESFDSTRRSIAMSTASRTSWLLNGFSVTFRKK